MDLEKKAIERIQTASEMSLSMYKKPLTVTFSGGKDSSVCLALTQKAGVPFNVQHNHTTVDAPETVYFIRKEYDRLENLALKGGGSAQSSIPTIRENALLCGTSSLEWGFHLPDSRDTAASI